MVAVWEITLSELAPWTFGGHAKSLLSSVSFLEKSSVLYVSDPEIASGGFCGRSGPCYVSPTSIGDRREPGGGGKVGLSKMHLRGRHWCVCGGNNSLRFDAEQKVLDAAGPGSSPGTMWSSDHCWLHSWESPGTRGCGSEGLPPRATSLVK